MELHEDIVSYGVNISVGTIFQVLPNFPKKSSPFFSFFFLSGPPNLRNVSITTHRQKEKKTHNAFPLVKCPRSQLPEYRNSSKVRINHASKATSPIEPSAELLHFLALYFIFITSS